MNTYENEIYPITLTVLNPSDMEEFCEKHPALAAESEEMMKSCVDMGGVTFYAADNEEDIFVYFSDPDLLSVPHEALHISNLIWKRIHAEYDLENDEPFAYLLTWVFKCIIMSDMFKDFIEITSGDKE